MVHAYILVFLVAVWQGYLGLDLASYCFALFMHTYLYWSPLSQGLSLTIALPSMALGKPFMHTCLFHQANLALVEGVMLQS